MVLLVILGLVGLTSPGDCWYSEGVGEPGGGSMDNLLQSTRW